MEHCTKAESIVFKFTMNIYQIDQIWSGKTGLNKSNMFKPYSACSLTTIGLKQNICKNPPVFEMK